MPFKFFPRHRRWASQREANAEPPPPPPPATKFRTLADMSDDEIRALEIRYGCPVRRR